jgi:EAL domain-containing protein (putative c-di-GMP-specific phosphodiesterase class I)
MSDRTFRLAPSDIDQAFERNEFSLVFQPKVDVATSRMTGAEAFIRWQHPVYGLLPPGLFLDFVESQGRMPDLTGYVFHTAFEAARKWAAQGRDWAISINVAPGTVTADDFCEGLAGLIQDYGLKASRVIIEIPERAVAQEPDILCEALNAVRALGVQVALDGGGIVPVDLAHFSPMPFTSIKVGGPASIRLAQRLGLKGKGAIAARLRYARHYNLEAVAVGAEDEATMAGLVDVGFTAAQGIWIQKPLTLEELLAWDGNWARGRIAMDPLPSGAALQLVKAAPQPSFMQKPPAVRNVVDPSAPRAAGPVDAPPVALDEVRGQVHASPAASGGVHAALEEPLRQDVTREDMQRVIEAVRAKRAAGTPTLQRKPVQRAETQMPVLEVDDLEDVVEDEEVTAPVGKHQGFGLPGDSCPPMKGLVQRRSVQR